MVAPRARNGYRTTPWHGDYGSLGTLLTSPDDGTLAIVVIGVVAWVGWAVMTVSLLIEIAARVRGIPAPLSGASHSRSWLQVSSSPSRHCSSSRSPSSRLPSRRPLHTHPLLRRPSPRHLACPSRSLSRPRRPSRRYRSTPSRPNLSQRPSTTPSSVATASGRSQTGCSGTAPGTSRSSTSTPTSSRGDPTSSSPEPFSGFPTRQNRSRRRTARRRTSSSGATPSRRLRSTNWATLCVSPRSSRHPVTPCSQTAPTCASPTSSGQAGN